MTLWAISFSGSLDSRARPLAAVVMCPAALFRSLATSRRSGSRFFRLRPIWRIRSSRPAKGLSEVLLASSERRLASLIKDTTSPRSPMPACTCSKAASDSRPWASRSLYFAVRSAVISSITSSLAGQLTAPLRRSFTSSRSCSFMFQLPPSEMSLAIRQSMMCLTRCHSAVFSS